VLKISPLIYGNFSIQFQVFAEWIANYVQNNLVHGTSGWLNQLNSYNYSRHHTFVSTTPVWQLGIIARDRFNVQLHSSDLTNMQLINIVNGIMDWGGMKPYSLSSAVLLRNALDSLNSITPTTILTKTLIDSLQLSGRIAARSKIFEMYDPTKWVIYYSRVANALACLTDRFTNYTPGILNWPIPTSRNRHFTTPNGYKGCHIRQQGSLAFIYASWLSSMVANTLNQNMASFGNPSFNCPAGSLNIAASMWQTYHVEMVLWMLGAAVF
jgi:hypothetical protein